MINLFRKAPALLLAVFIIANAASAQQTKADKIDAYIKKANQLGLFNGNIMVVNGGQVIYKTAIGFIDASAQTKLTEQYRFHIGSIAKEFNAVGIMMLKEQGKLDLDDVVSKYLPELPSWAGKVRIKNLLQYTSGIPDVKWNTVKNDSDNLADLKKLDKLDFEPGTNYAYNNNNVFLQRRITEKITGIPFKTFVEQRILKPCGMKTAIIDPTDSDALIAKAYNDNHKQDALGYPISGWTAVTLEDFYRWEQSLESFKLISPASTKWLITPVAPGKQCGLGGGGMDGDKLLTHVHDGTAMNYQALLAADIPKGRTVIFMTNNKQDNEFDLNTAIQQILDDKPYAMPTRSMLKSFQKQFETMSGEQILAFYQKLKTTNANDYGFDNETTLNEIGYFLTGRSTQTDAIIVFEYNTKLFPNSGNVFDSLGETYYKQGNMEKALLNYKKSYKLDPSNSTAKEIIGKLEK